MAHPTASETTPLIVSSPPIIDAQNIAIERGGSPDFVNGDGYRKGSSQAFRIAATMYSFVILGLFTASTGVMLGPLMSYYHLTYLQGSTLFLVPPVGYILSASLNSTIHARFGQRGVAIMGPLLHVLSAVVVACRPGNFGGALAGWGIMAMGTGLLDGSWCAMAAAMGSRANRVSGFLHGSYSTGAALGPFIFAELMAHNVNWWVWYWILAIASLFELLILFIAFRHSSASAYSQGKSITPTLIPTAPTLSSYKTDILSHPALWISALFFLMYVGNETTISGWIVLFMKNARHATPYLSNISSSGYWAGMAIGRLALGHFTDKIGARKGAAIYLACAIVLQLLFALIRSPIISIVLMTSLGFIMGPLFPSGIVVLTQLLPKELHVKAVSLVSSVGQVGGAALPFGIGAVVDSLGIGVFRWVLLVFSSVSLAIWWILAGTLPKTEEVDSSCGRVYIARRILTREREDR
ncbi:MFS general substrate transporter [Massarina eburnea CBS 473.64]|uniref:MFS general substrate transporter n=1 Tax=Massarina eburnea CBS 473.64 TaxID=1395130 RepID=A0A6A6RH16_9PLEO|nr:MFS general substrate transporter [Massarina eburnea CBS 473.64]